MLPEQKYKNGSHKILQITEKELFCIPLKTSFSRISNIFLQLLIIHDRAKSLQRKDTVSAIL